MRMFFSFSFLTLCLSGIANAEELRSRFQHERQMRDQQESKSPLTSQQNPQYHNQNHPSTHDHPPYYHDNSPYYHDHPPHFHNHPFNGHHSHPRFQHSPDFHKRISQSSRSDDSSDSSYSRSDESCCLSEEGRTGRNDSLMIPLDFIQTINQYSVNDLLLMNYIDGDVNDDTEIFVSSRFGADEERSAATIPKAAGCTPETKTIQLKSSDDPTILYIPQCTKIPQCGGCCSHSLLSCQPNQTETLAYQVLKTQYNGNKKLRLLGKEVVGVEKHLSCHCACKIKEEHCNTYQEYRANECRCVCTNTDEEKKCYKNYNKKLWDPELCACVCRDVIQCSSGYSFDQRECRCAPTPMRRRYAPTTDSPFLDEIIDEE